MSTILEWITGSDGIYRLDSRPSGYVRVERDRDGMQWVVGQTGIHINTRNPLASVVLEAAMDYATNNSKGGK